MRIIAGALGGRRLTAPRGNATRPTSDRVREALFSILGDISDARVLDLYAGTGALALEALSRGARDAVLVDNARPALESARENIEALSLGARVRVIAATVESALGTLERTTDAPRFDLVFADPPYANLEGATRAITRATRTLLGDDARVVLEHATRDAAPTIAGLTLDTTRAYGDTTVSIYRNTPIAPPP
jgi:16S rRNA (guanine966-N2)-methyltransferase